MHVLNKSITKKQLVLLVVWISFTIAAFGYFIQDKLVSFDVNNKLKAMDNKGLSNHLSSFITVDDPEKTHTILHFSTPGCDCQQYSEDHIKDINKLAGSNSYNIKRVIITEDDIIPATPSIALLDDIGSIIYFGPYGQGLACSQTSGYAQTVLNNYLQGYAAKIIINEAKGCYCKV